MVSHSRNCELKNRKPSLAYATGPLGRCRDSTNGDVKADDPFSCIEGRLATSLSFSLPGVAKLHTTENTRIWIAPPS